jgi:hypothetical protein
MFLCVVQVADGDPDTPHGDGMQERSMYSVRYLYLTVHTGEGERVSDELPERANRSCLFAKLVRGSEQAGA